jgi:hypothetical protein
MKTKKGLSLGAAPMAVLMLVFIGLVTVVGLKILTQVNVGEAAGSAVNTTIGNASAGLNQVVSQLSLVGLIVIMSIVIGVLWTSFGGMMSGQGGGI